MGITDTFVKYCFRLVDHYKEGRDCLTMKFYASIDGHTWQELPKEEKEVVDIDEAIKAVDLFRNLTGAACKYVPKNMKLIVKEV